MVPFSAAEYQRKRREKLKQLVLYEVHQAKNREYKKCRENLKTKSEKMKNEDQAIQDQDQDLQTEHRSQHPS